MLSEIVTVHATLPLQQPRIAAGRQVRVLAPIDDLLEDEVYYRFEVCDQRGDGSGWWEFTRQSNLRLLRRRSWWERLRAQLAAG